MTKHEEALFAWERFVAQRFGNKPLPSVRLAQRRGNKLLVLRRHLQELQKRGKERKKQ